MILKQTEGPAVISSFPAAPSWVLRRRSLDSPQPTYSQAAAHCTHCLLCTTQRSSHCLQSCHQRACSAQAAAAIRHYRGSSGRRAFMACWLSGSNAAAEPFSDGRSPSLPCAQQRVPTNQTDAFTVCSLHLAMRLFRQGDASLMLSPWGGLQANRTMRIKTVTQLEDGLQSA